MTFTYSKDFSMNGFTEIENAFIHEYLPSSSGNAVKVYLYGLFVCRNKDFDQGLDEISKTLGLSQAEIVDCFKYWEEFGLVSILKDDPFTVQYLPVRSLTSVKPRKYKVEKYGDFTKGLQALLPDRMISTNEYSEYFSIMETYAIKPEAMLMIVKYCVDRKGGDIGYRYVSKVAKDFGNRGIITVEKVEKELSTYVSRTSEIERILKAMNLKRQPEIDDLKLLNKWTKELNFEIDNIVFAASKIKKGSMAKLDEFMLDLYSMKSFTKEEIGAYMSQKQALYELAVKINKALSVYMEVIDTVVDTYTKRWVSYGYDADSLLYIASYCFKEGKNSLKEMDELIEGLYSKGIISLSSVGDYFEGIKRTDDFITKLLTTAGINRRPNSWDRENVNTWKAWNFTEDMILEAAKLASGKTSAIAYMNGILGNWKNNNVFTLADTLNYSGKISVANDNSQENYNREYQRRRALAISKAQKNLEKALAIDDFKEVYARISSIEKDLAFAEIANNKDALNSFENEKRQIISKATAMLEKIGLTLEDLTPKYACKKCNDTGYVGTKRCDCYDKKI